MSKLVLVEDDEDDIYFFKRALQDERITIDVTVLNDGAELLEYLQLHDCTTDLILLDLNMPKVGGLDVLAQLKSKGLLQRLNVIVYTTSARQSDIEKARRLGAKSYLQKPSSQDELRVLLKSLYLYWFKFNLFLRK